MANKEEEGKSREMPSLHNNVNLIFTASMYLPKWDFDKNNKLLESNIRHYTASFQLLFKIKY